MDSMLKRTTIRDIAEALGISHTTVSLALRDHPRIPSRHREEIKNAAKQLGYCRDPILAALHQYRFSGRPIQATFAWVNMWPEPASLRKHREFDEYWIGAQTAAGRNGYHVEEFNVSWKNLSRLGRILEARGILGLLLPPCPVGAHINPECIDWTKFSVVCFGHSYSNLPAHLVTSDQADAMRLAFEKIRARGYIRVGYATSANHLNVTRFGEGFLGAQARISERYRVPMLVIENGIADIKRLSAWVDAFRPDAIITDIPDLKAWIANVGLNVPRDVGLAACSVLDGNADAGIIQNSNEVGRTAAQLLADLVQNRQRGLSNCRHAVLLKSSWQDGETLPIRPLS